ncbi:MAG: DMT family transporter [Hyphomicrobiaceae bacterium]
MTVPRSARAGRPLSGNVLGMLGMLAAMACFVLNDAFVKLVGLKLPIAQIISIRGLFAFAIVLPIAWRFDALRAAHRLLQPTVALRVLGEVSATGLFLLGLVNMPFAEANAVLQFTPLAVTAASALVLGERVGWRRWLAAAAGLAGVLMIIKPGSSAFNWYSVPLLGSVLCVVVRDLATRRIDLGIPTLLITVVSAASVTVFGLFLSVLQPWQPATSKDILYLMGAAVFLVMGYFTITMALRSGEIAAVAPFRYSVVVYAIITGYLIWGEVPDIWAVAGVTIVATAGLYTFHRERRLKAKEQAMQSATSGAS